jgi:hypothetical protein
MLAAVLEIVTVGGAAYELGTLRWTGGAMAPRGVDYLDSFRLEGSTPVWRYVTPHCTIEKRLFMDQGANTTRSTTSIFGPTGLSPCPSRS